MERLLFCKARFARGGGCKSDARRLGLNKNTERKFKRLTGKCIAGKGGSTNYDEKSRCNFYKNIKIDIKSFDKEKQMWYLIITGMQVLRLLSFTTARTDIGFFSGFFHCLPEQIPLLIFPMSMYYT